MRFRVHVPAKVLPAVTGSQVFVYLEGTTVAVPYPVYSDGTSAATLAQGYSHPGGDVVFYLPYPGRVVVGVKPAGAPAPVLSPVVNAAEKVFAYSVMKAGGQPVDWVLA